MPATPQGTPMVRWSYRRPSWAALLWVVLLLALAPVPFFAHPAAAAAPASPPGGHLLVELCPGSDLAPAGPGIAAIRGGSPALRTVLAQWHLTRVELLDGPTDLLRFYADSPRFDAAAAARALTAAPGVDYAEPDYALRANAAPDDPLFSRQWYMPKIGLPAAWDLASGSGDIVVAMVDTGIDAEHPDLAGAVLPGYNFVADNTDTADDNGHGTYTAGLVGAIGNNGQGVAGVASGVRLLPVKILDQTGEGNVGDFARGIRWATDHGARLINISAGIEYNSTSMHQAVQYAAEHGVLVVASSGNTPDGTPRYPADFPEVLAVSATDASDNAAPFSSYGSYVDISAPGVNILSTSWDNGTPGYGWADGTSSSAPLVTGAAALLLSARPDLTAAQVEQYLLAGADDLGPKGRDPHFGVGRLDVLHSLQRLLSSSPTPTPAGTKPPVPTSTSGPAPVSGALTASPTHVAAGADVVLHGQGYEPGEFVGLRMMGPDGLNHELGTAQAAADGTFTQTVTIPETLSGGAARMLALGAASNVLATTSITITGAAGPTPAPPPPAAAETPSADPRAAFAPLNDPQSIGVAYFPAVQHSLRGVFLTYWQTHGGLPIFGYPISEEFVEVSPTDGKPYRVQYFQRNRFEDHPELAGAGDEVELGLLGQELTGGRAFAASPIAAGDADHLYFPQTQHRLGGAFLAYWEAHGGLAIFGYPISEEIQENGYTVQYFQRNRFEYHPEYAGTPNAVLLGLLGVDAAHARNFLH